MKTFLLSIVILLSGLTGCSQNVTNKKMDNRIQNIKFNPLTPEEAAVILDKGTELPFTGKYTDFSEKGTYVCKQCNAPFYRSSDKFKSCLLYTSPSPRD